MIALLLAGLPAGAARLPDWAAEIAAGAPTVESGASRIGWRILLREARYTVEPDGTLHVRHRLAHQSLSSRGTDVGVGAVYFDDRTKLRRSRAWHLPPNGETTRSRGGSAVDVTPPDMLTDRGMRLLGVSDVKRGSLVFFEFETEQLPYVLSLAESFYEEVPVGTARLELVLPPGWSARHDWLRSDGREPESDGATLRWELHDLPAAPLDQTQAELPWERAPLLVIGLDPPDGAEVASPAVAGWAELSDWYTGLIGHRNAADAGVAAEAGTGSSSDVGGRLEQIVAVAEFVRDEVRYVAKEIGIGGYQPRPAGETLAARFGDCKDKSTLLQSLLASDGIRSYPVLINATTRETVSETVPSLYAFNHMIVAVALPEGLTLPERYRHAVGEIPGLGRLLFIDPTDEYTAIGWLPAALSGKRGLLVAGDQGRLVTLPGDDPAAHRVEQQLEWRFVKDGTIEYDLRLRRYGEPAAEARASYRYSAQDRRDLVEHWLVERWVEVSVEEYRVEEPDDGSFVEQITGNLSLGERAGASLSQRMFLPAEHSVARPPLGRRELPVVFEHPLTLTQEARIIGAPEGASIRTASSKELPGGSIACVAEDGEDASSARCVLELSRTRFEPDGFRELRRIYAAVKSMSSFALLLPE
jgi:hypothetical protein